MIYWENVLVDPAVPFDITFRIVTHDDQGGGDCEDVTEDHVVDGASAVIPGRVSMIPAHRLILGLTSPVFSSQLYGRWRESGDQVIEVRDVTPAAFRTMVNYMYGIPLNYSVEFLTLEKAQELFDIVYAAKKYLIPQLSQEIVALINKAEITTNTLEVEKMERLAEQYSHLEEASSALLAKCKTEKENAVKEAKLVSGKERLMVTPLGQIIRENENGDPVAGAVPLFVEPNNLENIPAFQPVEPPLVPIIPQLMGNMEILEVSSDNEENLDVSLDLNGVVENVEEIMDLGVPEPVLPGIAIQNNFGYIVGIPGDIRDNAAQDIVPQQLVGNGPAEGIMINVNVVER